MSRHEDIREGAAVCSLHEVDPLEATIIQCLRAAQAAAHRRAAPPPCGLGQGFAALYGLVRDHAVRPVEFMTPNAAGVSADEACLARFIRAAAEGEREEALVHAFAVLRADIAFQSVTLARDLGLGLRRATLRRGRDQRLH